MSRKRSRNRSRVTDRPPASVNSSHDSADSDQSDSLRPPPVETTSTPPPVQAAEKETSSSTEGLAPTAESSSDKPAQGPASPPKPPPHVVLTKKSFFDVPESVASSPAPRPQITKQAPSTEKPALSPTEAAQHEHKQSAQPPVEHKADKPLAPEETEAQQPASPPASDKAEPAVDDLELAAKAKEQSSIAAAAAAASEEEDFTPAVSEHAKSWPPAAPEEKKEQTLRGFPEAPASQKSADSAPQKATAESVEVQTKAPKAGPLDRTAPGIGPAPDLRPQPPAESQKQKRSESAPQAKGKSAGDKAETKKKKKLVESGKHEAIQEEFFARGEAVSSENLAKFAEVSAQHEAVLEATPPASPLSPEQIERRRRLRRVVLMVVVGALSLALVGAYKLKLQRAADTETRASARPSTSLASATPPPSHRVLIAPPPASPAPVAQVSASASTEPVASASASAAPSASVAASAAPSSSAVAAASTLPDGVNPKKEAERLLNVGRYKDAIRMAEAAIELDPEDAYPYLYLGAALQSSGRWKDGIAAYSKCVHTAKKGPVAECRAVGGH